MARKRLERPSVQEKGWTQTSFGPALYIRIFTNNYRPLSWREAYDAFAEAYPDKWAVQFFPPTPSLRDSVNVYHLFVLEEAPTGVDISLGCPASRSCLHV